MKTEAPLLTKTLLVLGVFSIAVLTTYGAISNGGSLNSTPYQTRNTHADATLSRLTNGSGAAILDSIIARVQANAKEKGGTPVNISAYNAYIDTYLNKIDTFDNTTRINLGSDYAFLFQYMYPRVYEMRMKEDSNISSIIQGFKEAIGTNDSNISSSITGVNISTGASSISGNAPIVESSNIFSGAGIPSTIKFPNTDGTECDTISVGGKIWATCSLAGGKQYQWGRSVGFAPGITAGSTNSLSLETVTDIESATKTNKILTSLTDNYLTYMKENPPEGWYGNTPQGPCPTGWHIPTTAEITTMLSAYGTIIQKYIINANTTGARSDAEAAHCFSPSAADLKNNGNYVGACYQSIYGPRRNNLLVLKAGLIRSPEDSYPYFSDKFMVSDLSYPSPEGYGRNPLTLREIKCVKN